MSTEVFVYVFCVLHTTFGAMTRAKKNRIRTAVPYMKWMPVENDENVCFNVGS